MEDHLAIGSTGKTLTTLRNLLSVTLYLDISQVYICMRNRGAPYTFQIKDHPVVKLINKREKKKKSKLSPLTKIILASG